LAHCRFGPKRHPPPPKESARNNRPSPFWAGWAGSLRPTRRSGHTRLLQVRDALRSCSVTDLGREWQARAKPGNMVGDEVGAFEDGARAGSERISTVRRNDNLKEGARRWLGHCRWRTNFSERNLHPYRPLWFPPAKSNDPSGLEPGGSPWAT